MFFFYRKFPLNFPSKKNAVNVHVNSFFTRKLNLIDTLERPLPIFTVKIRIHSNGLGYFLRPLYFLKIIIIET